MTDTGAGQHRQWAKRTVCAGVAAIALLAAACGGKAKPAAPPPTFTPAPAPVQEPAATRPAHPVVGQTCLRGLTSYRFSGTFSLQAAAAAPSSGGETSLTGSLANLLRNVTFEGAAHAPDRYDATVNFGGNGVQSLQIVRIGSRTYSRFGDGAWQEGDQLSGLGGIAQLDPETLCQTLLARLDAGGQTPAHETVNGVPALRYTISGPQLLGALTGDTGNADDATAGAAPASGQATVWTAQQGGYPVRFQIDGSNQLGQLSLLVNVTDVNGKDIQISAPATVTPAAGR